MLEAIEPRTLLAAMVTLNPNGELLVLGTDSGEMMVIAEAGQLISVLVNGETSTFAATSVARINVDGAGGHDSIRNDTTIVAMLAGGDGDDTLVGGLAGDHFWGGIGTNFITSQNDVAVLDYARRMSDGGVTSFTFESNQILGQQRWYLYGGEGTIDFFDILFEVPRRLDMRLTDGRDRFFGNSPDFPAQAIRLDAGPGNDTLYDFGLPSFQSVPSFEMDGGKGNDNFYILGRVDTLFGGDGDDFANDRSFVAANQSAVIDLGTGYDIHDCSPENFSGTGAEVFRAGAGVEEFRGPSGIGNYTLLGNELDNTLSAAVTDSVTVLGMGGNDTLISNGGTSEASVLLDGGDDDDRLMAVFDTHTLLGGAGNDTIIGREGADLIDGGPGNDRIEAGTFSVDTIIAGSGEDEVILPVDGLAHFADTPQLVSLSLGANARLTTTAGGTTIIRTRSLSLAPTAQLDLADNALILDYTGDSPIESIRAALQSGHAGGAWNGPGINSSVAALPSPLPLSQSTGRGSDGVGFAESADLFSSFPAVFTGQAVDDSALLLRYTRNGDADLSGTVDMADFSRLAANFNATTNRWSAGDYNYDGVTGFNDFAQLAAGFGQTPMRALSGQWAHESVKSLFSRVNGLFDLDLEI